jgi:hypothetical protein
MSQPQERRPYYPPRQHTRALPLSRRFPPFDPDAAYNQAGSTSPWSFPSATSLENDVAAEDRESETGAELPDETYEVVDGCST